LRRRYRCIRDISAALVVPTAENHPDAAKARATAEATSKRKSKCNKDKHFDGWGATAALQRLHCLAVWLRSSPLHQDLWDEAIGIRLGIDNDTRWSSWYYMINRAIRKKDEIIRFLHENAEACGPNTLSHADWETLGQTHEFLQIFTSGTL
jgi:hypothetical protein